MSPYEPGPAQGVQLGFVAFCEAISLSCFMFYFKCGSLEHSTVLTRP